jgi:hypothetical protein
MADDRRQSSEVGSRNAEVGILKSEVGMRKWEWLDFGMRFEGA